MRNTLIFGGTSEGRELAEIFAAKEEKVTVSVATDYGASMLEACKDSVKICVGRLSSYEMQELILNGGFNLVIDATHPYAVEVTVNIKSACLNLNVPYMRLVREKSKEENFIYVKSTFEVAQLKLEENILITTGSKEIRTFSKIPNIEKSVYVRVLPTCEAVSACVEAGIPKNHILALNPPFSCEDNEKIIDKFEIKTIITKDGGDKGGFPEKVKAAKSRGVKLIVIERPSFDKGYSFNEVLDILFKEEI